MKQYYKQIKKHLVCPPRDAKRCMANVRQSVEQLRQEKPEITTKEIEEFLGEPQDVAQMFIDTLELAEVACYRHRRKLLRRLAAGVCAAMVLLSIYWVYYAIKHQPISTIVVWESEIWDVPDDPREINP